VELALYDAREDRLEEAQRRFGTRLFRTMDEALAWSPDVLVISTPPDQHDPYIELALDRGLHHFCEANLWTYDDAAVQRISQAKDLLSVPSCSMHFLPVVRELKRIVAEELGRLHAYQMFLSTWMPGWHPQEGAEFYARHRSTSAGREMVPFELLHLNYIFGEPVEVSGYAARCGELPYESEDTWCLQMELEDGGYGQLVVLMASPRLYRKGRACGTGGCTEFDLLEGTIRRQLPDLGIDDLRRFGRLADILEDAYREEIHTFLETLLGRGSWPHSYHASRVATATLAAAEQSALTGRREPVVPARQPELVPGGSQEVLRTRGRNAETQQARE
jgi:predicted dehydrogenase